MKTFILHIALLSIGTLLAACSDHDLPTPATTEAGRVIIAYSTGSLQTRATTKTIEAGWKDWNENTVTRLDLFIIDADGNVKHYTTPEDYSYIDPQDESYKILELPETSGITPADITASQTYYLVANCPSVAGIKTLTELNAASISTNGTDPTLNYNGKQKKFVMSAEGTRNVSGKGITLTFDLKRAAAKIALHIQSKGSQDILSDLTYRMFNHATSAYVLSREEDHNYDWLNHPEENFVSPNDQQYHEGTNGKSLIFYSYPNDWFDKTKIPEIEGKYSIEDLHAEPPIDPEKESYILLRATYQGKPGYYKVPLNYGLPDFNEQRELDKTQYQQVRDLYRLKRNHFYQIEVNIDGEGGPIEDPVTPRFTIHINDWQWGNSYQLSEDSFTEDNQTTNN